MRYVFERVLLAAIALLLWRCWCLEGVLVPNRIDSGSMAPDLLGPHHRVDCDDCGFPFSCEVGAVPAGSRAVCPNCGCPDNPLDDAAGLPGDGLLLDRSVYSWRMPQRWEIVAFRHPAAADQVCVKRVVGLPGEQVEIRQGDVYVDGQIQRKTLDQQRSMAIPVHDASYEPTQNNPALPPRWFGEGASSRWGGHAGRFAYAPAKEQGGFDWLVYRHWRRVPNAPDQVEVVPIDDTSGYNRRHPRRVEEVVPVRDLLLSFDVLEAWGDGKLAVRMTDGATQFEFRASASTGGYQARLDGHILPDGVGRLPGPIHGARFEFSMIDHQYLVAMDGAVIGVWKTPPDGAWSASTAEPFRIGASRLGMVIENLRLFRDVYYTQPTGVHARWGVGRPVRLGPDEFFVLGDNSMVSEDSRTWPGGPGVAATFLIGRPLVVHFPLRQLRLGPLEFRVPDPGRMRYIR